jgi:hypothetical protein
LRRGGGGLTKPGLRGVLIRRMALVEAREAVIRDLVPERSHAIYVSKPDMVADLIEQAASEANSAARYHAKSSKGSAVETKPERLRKGRRKPDD